MRRVLAAITSVAAFAIAAPAAQADRAECSGPLETHYSAHYHAVKKALGARAPGRNIRRWGKRYHLKDGWHVRPAKCGELRRSLRQLRALRRPAGAYLVRTAVAPAQRPAGTLTAGVRGNLPYCTWGPESGGNYRAVNPNGHYGKYQFDQQTWESVGGSGRPDQAAPPEQDRRAAILYSQRGGQPWSNC